MQRHRRIHLQNLRISVGARRHHFDERIGIPFLCECDNEHCREFVVVTLPAFDRVLKEQLVLLASGHAVEGGTHVEGGDGYEIYQVADEQHATGA